MLTFFLIARRHYIIKEKDFKNIDLEEMEENTKENTKEEYSENFNFKEMWKLSTEKIKSEESESKELIDDLSNLITTRSQSQIEKSTLIDLLTHLKLNNLKTLNSQVLINCTKILRSPPEIVLMIPSTYREGQNYLINTTQNLLNNIAEEELHLIQIIILISENPWDVKMKEKKENITKLINKNFKKEINKGILEVISPPIEFFPPNLEKTKPTLGDPPLRMIWRTKQNLDYAFAMLHVLNSKPNTKYYVQLEDDIITVPGKYFLKNYLNN
ncbi:hypothetical protein ACQ4LE_002181 [Meloidogyne hapla]|uniref:MGAT4 conserved region domain-containing protein n=1 Tax=Meloidogyne hapla TaxID=6305 RepID=A0A1I8BH48_MELHA